MIAVNVLRKLSEILFINRLDETWTGLAQQISLQKSGVD